MSDFSVYKEVRVDLTIYSCTCAECRKELKVDVEVDRDNDLRLVVERCDCGDID